MAKGLFDDAKVTPIDTHDTKEDFKDVFQNQAAQAAKRASDASDANRKKSNVMDESIASINASGLGGGSGADKVEADLKELESISEEDVALAEELIFNGYVEKEVKVDNIKDLTVTVCSTTAGEASIVEEMVLEYIGTFKDEDGEIENLPSANAKAYRQMVEAAISIKSIKGKELSDKAAYQLVGVKKGIGRYDELVFEGKMDEASKILDMIKDAIKYRALVIRRMSTQMIDLIVSIKYNFNIKLYEIMTVKDILPK